MSTAAALKTFAKNENAFIEGLATGDPDALQLPKSISFTTFQARRL